MRKNFFKNGLFFVAFFSFLFLIGCNNNPTNNNVHIHDEVQSVGQFDDENHSITTFCKSCYEILGVEYRAHKLQVKSQTEDETGKRTYYECIDCGYEKMEFIESPGHIHSMEYTAAEESTCTSKGHMEYYFCSGCNTLFYDEAGINSINNINDTILPYDDHQIDSHAEYKNATCDEDGNREYYHCCECNKYFESEEEHENLYDESLSFLIEKRHSYSSYSYGYNATCLNEGKYEIKKCRICEKYFKYSDGTYIEIQEDVNTIDLTIPALGHDYGELCSNGLTHGKNCVRCGLSMSAEEHSYENGECSVCGQKEIQKAVLSDFEYTIENNCLYIEKLKTEYEYLIIDFNEYDDVVIKEGAFDYDSQGPTRYLKQLYLGTNVKSLESQNNLCLEKLCVHLYDNSISLGDLTSTKIKDVYFFGGSSFSSYALNNASTEQIFPNGFNFYYNSKLLTEFAYTSSKNGYTDVIKGITGCGSISDITIYADTTDKSVNIEYPRNFFPNVNNLKVQYPSAFNDYVDSVEESYIYTINGNTHTFNNIYIELKKCILSKEAQIVTNNFYYKGTPSEYADNVTIEAKGALYCDKGTYFWKPTETSNRPIGYYEAEAINLSASNGVIKDYQFYGLHGIKTYYLQNVTQIGKKAISYSSTDTEIYLYSCLEKIDKDFLYKMNNNATIKFTERDGYQYLGNQDNPYLVLYSYNKDLEDIDLDNIVIDSSTKFMLPLKNINQSDGFNVYYNEEQVDLVNDFISVENKINNFYVLNEEGVNQFNGRNYSKVVDLIIYNDNAELYPIEVGRFAYYSFIENVILKGCMIYKGAFDWCDNINTIKLVGCDCDYVDNPYYRIFGYSSPTKISVPMYMSKYVANTDELIELEINSVLKKDLTYDREFPEGNIYGCTYPKLEKVTSTDTNTYLVNKIGAYAFQGCSSLREIPFAYIEEFGYMSMAETHLDLLTLYAKNINFTDAFDNSEIEELRIAIYPDQNNEYNLNEFIQTTNNKTFKTPTAYAKKITAHLYVNNVGFTSEPIDISDESAPLHSFFEKLTLDSIEYLDAPALYGFENVFKEIDARNLTSYSFYCLNKLEKLTLGTCKFDALPNSLEELVIYGSLNNNTENVLSTKVGLKKITAYNVSEITNLKYLPNLETLIISNGNNVREVNVKNLIILEADSYSYRFDNCLFDNMSIPSDFTMKSFYNVQITNLFYPGTLKNWCEKDDLSNHPLNNVSYLCVQDNLGETTFNGNKYTIIKDSFRFSDDVVSINSEAFYNYNGISELIIPSTITSIGENAFYNCVNLKKVRFEEGSQSLSIGKSAFYGCSGLTDIEMSNGVANINNAAFYGCRSLTNLIIPNSVISIGRSAFGECSGLESISIPFIGSSVDGTSNTHFGYIFGASSYSYNSSYVPSALKEVIITGGTNIEKYAFSRCGSLTSIIIQKGVTSIGSEAFSNCSSLISIIIPEGVTSIGSEAFSNCSSLISIIIPEGVTWICCDAFKGCSNLQKISIPFVGTLLDGTEYTHFGSIFGARSYSENSSYVPSTLKEVIITGSTSIGSRAFYGCSSITSIVISSSITSIGERVVNECSNLGIIYYGGNVSDWSNIEISTYNELLQSTTICYYSETKPTDSTNKYWHYVNNEIVVWE
ncbi:MAG: leucine-rich repeat domain-containing protein [Anaeroplasma sp.]